MKKRGMELKTVVSWVIQNVGHDVRLAFRLSYNISYNALRMTRIRLSTDTSEYTVHTVRIRVSTLYILYGYEYIYSSTILTIQKLNQSITKTCTIN